MHPEARERSFACKVFRLCNLACMVRKRKINPTTMNVYLRPKVTHRHGTALNMPAWTPRPPGTRPSWLAWNLCLPEEKIQRVLLIRIVGPISALIRNLKHG